MIGILGVGHLAEALVPGLLRGHAPETVLLGPRNAETAETLSDEYGVDIADSSAALVAQSDVVILATRPDQAVDAATGLPWRHGQTVISVCAGLKRAALEPVVAPAHLSRAMPITAAALGASPTTIYPDDPQARAALAPLGPVIPISKEESFDVACTSAAYYGWVFAVMHEAAEALIGRGLSAARARALIAETTAAAGRVAAGDVNRPTEDWLEALATPGGITEQGLDVLRDRDALDAVRAATEAVADRLAGGAPRPRNK